MIDYAVNKGYIPEWLGWLIWISVFLIVVGSLLFWGQAVQEDLVRQNTCVKYFNTYGAVPDLPPSELNFSVPAKGIIINTSGEYMTL